MSYLPQTCGEENFTILVLLIVFLFMIIMTDEQKIMNSFNPRSDTSASCLLELLQYFSLRLDEVVLPP